MENSSFDNFDVQLNEAGRSFLRVTGKWALFLSIIGFIGVGFFLLAALAMFSMGSFGGGLFGGVGGAVIGAVYVVFAAIFFFPLFYLFQFSSRIKRAFEENDSVVLNDALGSLKTHYKLAGIFTIVFIALYIVLIFIMVGAGISGAM
ncbi:MULTISPECIES: DUF5362 family protein [unclassified Flavobacterium]|uniref:DUF5362 family protein n=1 Tax=unclassified Flavobacterium TaxID=196869 RepID=UPI001F137B27|nr:MULTISPECIES: DUF5362 family protein [unclassified Flavobacterium]UMY65235.1 DUF5362 family protein [Flavobacterium sp. HJ-32-4]